MRRFGVGASLAGVDARSGTVWLTVGASGAASAGALRVGVSRDPVTDPAVSFDWTLEHATCATLLGYPDRAGAGLEPELAAAMPDVSSDGRTYTFRIRPGWRFAPPSREPVTARSMQATIERALSPKLGDNAPAYGFFGDIAGARAFREGRTPRLAGVRANGDRLTIRLVRPAGDLPARLALPFFCAVPASTPVERNGVRAPIPTAGPFSVVFRDRRRVVLRRNPGYAGSRRVTQDEIQFEVGVGTDEALARVQRGSLDDYRLGIPDLFLPELQPGGRYARTLRAGAGKARYLLNPALYVRAFALNGERPMFRDPAARRAVNYAIDRRALAGLFGAEPTDQYVPRAMPGFRDARVYPDEPDLAKARALLAHGGRAVFWTCGGVVCRQVGEIVRRELRPIGIDVAIRQYDDWDARASQPGAAYDILDVALPVDFGDPAAALEPLLGGDPALAPRLRRAAGLTGSARLAAYATIDRLAARGSAPLAAFANDNAGELVSARVGCDVYQAVYGGVSLAALCARG